MPVPIATIESLDLVEIGAWGAKAEGTLGVGKQSLHIELPAHHNILGTANAREAYQSILAVLLHRSVEFLLSPAQGLEGIQALQRLSGATIEPGQGN